jgi:hypothetical protein
VREADRPQVRTRDGFVLRRTGGYNICKVALVFSQPSPMISVDRMRRWR